jgi:ABC-type polysaccharide/polyol phosphate export permease
MTSQTQQSAAPGGAPDEPERVPAGFDDYAGEYHVHVPHKVGLPPLGPYVRMLWKRREFARELSRMQLRSQHYNTVFGQLWLVINPLMLALVYFVLIDILRSGSRGAEFFGHLLGALFVFYFVHGCLSQGVKSVVSGGRLILNTAFPRVLLPLAAVTTAFKRFLPTIPIYAIVHVATGLPITPELLWLPVILVIFTVLGAGLAMLAAAAQVYFRDLRNFLPYALRLWLYASPVLYYAHEVPDRYDAILAINPLGPALTAWSDVLTAGQSPSAETLLLGVVWASVIFVAGALFFVSREREFAVRL